MIVKLTLKEDCDQERLALGYRELKLLLNVGPFPGGGDCLFVEADGTVMAINSNDLIHDLDFYDMTLPSVNLQRTS